MTDIPPWGEDVTRSMPPVAPEPPTPPSPPSPPAERTPAAETPAAEHGLPLWSALEVVALVALLLGLFVPEHDTQLWDGSEAWSVFAIVCAVAQLVPLLRRSTKLDETQAWHVAAVGAAGLALYWLLLVLPVIGRNTSFAVTLATAAAAGGVWLAPERRR